jgi:hypothetical protein
MNRHAHQEILKRGNRAAAEVNAASAQAAIAVTP